MVDKKCPFCNELNKIDNKFCIYCGKKFPVFEDAAENISKDAGSDVSNSEDEQTGDENEFISCPICNTLNSQESIECKNCGHLLKTDIIKTLRISKKKYKNCPKCGNILSLNDNRCIICGYDFAVINYDSPDDFFEMKPKFKEYRKNIDFFKDINKFGDYDKFLIQFRELCVENNADLSIYDVGMIKCPQCLEFFSFISPHFIKTHKCPHCANKFDFYSSESYCLNCRRPVKEGQTECECGYEFADIECPHCKTSNSYTNNHCISCGNSLWDSDFILPSIKPRGCKYTEDNNSFFLNIDFLKKESLKEPYATNNRIHSQVLRSEYLKCDRIVKEIHSRWWIASPFDCINCLRKIEPFDDHCQKCNIVHHNAVYDNRVIELKTIKNNYVKTERSINELSSLKWTYKLTDEDLDDYLKSLAPEIGESHLKYCQRLFKEFAEQSVISYLIKSDWSLYFKNTCIRCGCEFEPYNLYCPSCGMKKSVPFLSVYFNDDNIRPEKFSGQFKGFSKDVKSICRDNGGDISNAGSGIVGCPNCSNYFHYLTFDFIDTHKCPHCGVQFNIDAKIPDVRPGDYCGFSCRHYREEYVNDSGEIVAESTGNCYRYCDIGHSIGGFCKYYE